MERIDRNSGESWAEFTKDGKVADLGRKIGRNDPFWTRMRERECVCVRGDRRRIRIAQEH